MKSLVALAGIVIAVIGCGESVGPDCEIGDKDRVNVYAYLSCDQKAGWSGSPTEWEIRGADGCVVPGYEERYQRGRYTRIALLELPENEEYHVRVYVRGESSPWHEKTIRIGPKPPTDTIDGIIQTTDTTICLGF